MIGRLCSDLHADGIDVAAEQAAAAEVAVQPLSSLVGIGWWWQTSAPALQPVLGATGRHPLRIALALSAPNPLYATDQHDNPTV